MQTAEIQSLKQVETLNMERKKLLFNTNKYKEALEEQVSDLKENAIRFALQGLIFGGVALGTYFLVRAFQKKEKAENQAPSNLTHPKSGFSSTLFASIQGYIASFLLSIAREKITEFLESKLKQPRNGPASENPA